MPGCSKNSSRGAAVRAAGFLLALLAGCSAPSNKGLPSASVERGDILQRVSVSGLLVPARRTVIVAPYAGYVGELFVGVGAKVKKGDPLVRVVQTLQGASDQAFPIRAPFTGIVTNVFAREGEAVEANRDRGSLLRLDDLTELWIEADLPEIDVAKVRVGLEAIVRPAGDPGKSFKGEVRTIALAAKEGKDWERGKVDFPIRIFLKERDEVLKPGMTLVVDVVVAKAEGVLTLRQEFVRKESDKFYVTTLDGGRKEVQIGLQNEERVEIRAGLAEGEKVRMVDFSGLAGSRGG